MSEGASSLRLLEPRSLAGAERLASRAAMPPLVRSTARGAGGFADRFFQSWLGVERPVSVAVDRSPRALGFPSPWYELPSDRHLAARPMPARPIVAAPGAPSRELRAIDLVLQSALPAESTGYRHGEAVEAPPAASIGQHALDQLARVDRLLRGVIHTPASTVELAALASRPVGTLGASVLGASIAPRGATIDGPSLRGARAESASPGSQWVAPGQPISTAAQRGIERTLLTPMLVPALSASPVVVAAAVARRVATPSFVAAAPIGATAVPASSGGVVASLASAAEPVLSLSTPVAAAPTLGVAPGLAMGPAVVWPRLQAFIERIAGPTTLGDAGFVLPVQAYDGAAPSARAADAPAGLPYVELASAPTSWGRGADPRSLLPLPVIAPNTPAQSVTPGSPRPSMGGSFVHGSAQQPTRAGEHAPATLAGELARQAPLASYRPGRLAQRAELLATIAVQRADRQLGTSSVVEQRSIQWSSDAFTVVALAPRGEAPGARASLAPAWAASSADASGSFAPAPFASSPFGTAPMTLRSPAQLAAVMPDAAARTHARGSRSAAPSDLATERAFVAQGGVLAGAPSAQRGALAMPSALGAASSTQPFVRVAPLSIASLLAFADAQLGPRLLEGARPLPVNVPSAVYLQPDEAPAARAVSTGRPAPARTFVAPSPALRGVPRALDLGSDFSLAALGTLGYAPAQAAYEPAPQSAAIGQLGRRSEQLAGELGVRVGSLASEFLIDVQPNVEADTPASTLHAATAGHAWLSTSDWVLLSLFPSMTTAHQVASSSAAHAAGLAQPGVARDGRFPLAANVAQSPLGARPMSTQPGGAPVEGPLSSLAPVLSSLVAPSMSFGDDSRTPTTAYLPDGRMPRGNRMIARSAALPVVAGPPSASIASTVAATDRRAAAPIGAPLWGQMRALVEPSVTSPAPTPSSAHGVGRAAMELVQPYVEAARAESTGASSFIRQATPVVPISAPDAPTKSLVRALSAASSTPSNDRLSMADLTLISIVSATEQVAAAGTGPSPDLAPASGKGDPNSAHATGAGFGGDVEQEIELVAERALDRLTDEMRRYNDHKGGTWET